MEKQQGSYAALPCTSSSPASWRNRKKTMQPSVQWWWPCWPGRNRKDGMQPPHVLAAALLAKENQEGVYAPSPFHCETTCRQTGREETPPLPHRQPADSEEWQAEIIITEAKKQPNASCIDD